MGLEGLVTVEKIRAAINASLSGLSNSNATITITKNDGTTSTITINNVANATTATKLGSSTVGSGVKAIYLNAGTATRVIVLWGKQHAGVLKRWHYNSL